MPYIKTNGIKTYYETKGSGQPLVFIHGLANARDAWDEQVEYFSNKFKIITYDVRGHGKSEGSDDEYSIELFADDLHELLWKLKIENPVLCGLSMGGMIAQTYAIKHPVRLLVLADTFRSGKVTELTKYLPKETIKQIAISTPLDVFFGIADLTLLNNVKETVKTKVRQWFEDMSPEEFAKVILACYNFEKINPSKIHSPTLILLGDNETPVTKVTSKTLRDKIPNAKLFEIKNSTHISNLENPRQFNTILSLFLAENP